MDIHRIVCKLIYLSEIIKYHIIIVRLKYKNIHGDFWVLVKISNRSNLESKPYIRNETRQCVGGNFHINACIVCGWLKGGLCGYHCHSISNRREKLLTELKHSYFHFSGWFLIGSSNYPLVVSNVILHLIPLIITPPLLCASDIFLSCPASFIVLLSGITSSHVQRHLS